MEQTIAEAWPDLIIVGFVTIGLPLWALGLVIGAWHQRIIDRGKIKRYGATFGSRLI